MSCCNKCGTQLTGGSAFCSKCGAPQSTSTAGTSAPRVERKQAHPDRPRDPMAAVRPVLAGMKKLYKETILPIEEMYAFPSFHSPSMTDTDFDAKPMVLLIGQYSTGKTTFIRYLLERDFPDCRIGPEPTTDQFMAVMWGNKDRVIPGNALAMQDDKPFRGLQRFGSAFLNKFAASACRSPILEKLTFIDTPGVLSGEKQRIQRGYNFSSVIEWFAERADRILLLFDAHKLDISDEFKGAIEALRGHDSKVRVVLNKADKISTQQLMRVYGALMWALGKVIKTPEVRRVYIGSFWDKPYENKDQQELFEAEEADLLADLRSLPRNSAMRKLNEMVKRARMCRVHAYIINHLRNQFGWFGKKSTQSKLLDGLLNEYKKVQVEHDLPMGDFPHVVRFREKLRQYQIHKFPKLDKRALERMERALSVDLPQLMKRLPGESHYQEMTQENNGNEVNPFSKEHSRAKVGQSWLIAGRTKANYDNIFHNLDLSNGKISGSKVRDTLVKHAGSALNRDQLGLVWELADIDKDGYLDQDEFAVAMYCIDQVKSGEWAGEGGLPKTLPDNVMPPSKR